MKHITITYSIYGNFDYDRLKTSIISVLNQEEIVPHIIVAEENIESKVKELLKEFPIEHVFNQASNLNEGLIQYNPGKIRNLAVRKVETEFIYLSDADIIYCNKNYFKYLLDELKGEEALIWPPSRRLIKEDVDKFINLTELLGIDEAVKKLVFPNDYLASFNYNVEHLKIVEHKENGRIYTTSLSTFKEYLKNENMKGLEPTFWNDVVHIGGIFTKTEMMRKVGNYTNVYLTWGYEDMDLQWKLDELFSTRRLPCDKNFEVIHLDHDKGYFSKEQNRINRLLFEKRKKEGVEKAIKYDLMSQNE